jgi:hypothetical protein
MRSSSGYFLSHRFWRNLRNGIPGTLWGLLYSVRERVLSPSYLRDLADAILSRNVEPSENESELEREVLEIETLWRQFGAVGKRESGYGSVYAEVIRDLPTVTNVLELGIAGGGSHRTWSAIWPEASIYGIDIDPETAINEPRITTYVADQLSVQQLLAVSENLPKSFELIVDDGWHQPEAGLKSLSVLLPRLSPGGYYIVEDIVWSRYHRIWKRVISTLSGQYQFSFKLVGSSWSQETIGGPYGLLLIRRPL